MWFGHIWHKIFQNLNFSYFWKSNIFQQNLSFIFKYNWFLHIWHRIDFSRLSFELSVQYPVKFKLLNACFILKKFTGIFQICAICVSFIDLKFLLCSSPWLPEAFHDLELTFVPEFQKRNRNFSLSNLTHFPYFGLIKIGAICV